MTGRPSAGAGSRGASRGEEVRRLVERSVEELAGQLEHGDRTRLDAFLKALGRFHRYSFNNVLLILCQRPDARRVAGFHTWRSLGRTVKRGEKGIAIFAPMLIKPKAEPEPEHAEKRTADTAPRLRFRVVYVFDVSQTEGEPLPDLDRVQGDPGEALGRLEAAVRKAGIELETAESLGGAEGVSSGGRIRLRAGLPPAERFGVLAHEWAHEILHQSDREHMPDKTVRETEAEAVAFVVCRAAGLEGRSASADYIRLYRGDTETLAASLDRIQKTASLIIEAMEGGGESDRGSASPTLERPQRQR